MVHMPSLPWQRLPEFVPALAAQTAIAAAPLHMLILTASRAGMVRLMTWPEVDLKEKLWTIPGGRMKGGVEHRVPLSAATIELLERMAGEKRLRLTARIIRAAPALDLVFPNSQGKLLSDMTLTLLLRRMNRVEDGQPAPWRDGQTSEPITAHGFGQRSACGRASRRHTLGRSSRRPWRMSWATRSRLPISGRTCWRSAGVDGGVGLLHRTPMNALIATQCRFFT